MSLRVVLPLTAPLTSYRVESFGPAQQFPAEDVKVYLNTLLSQDPETWAGLAGLPQL